jgi:hypothetical protein
VGGGFGARPERVKTGPGRYCQGPFFCYSSLYKYLRSKYVYVCVSHILATIGACIQAQCAEGGGVPRINIKCSICVLLDNNELYRKKKCCSVREMDSCWEDIAISNGETREEFSKKVT